MNLKGLIKGTICLLGFMLVLVAWHMPAQATIINVPTNYTTIQAAINAAGSGDIINVAAGTYAGFTVATANIEVRGAQHGNDPAGATTRGSESIITSTITITADDVALNGFKMTSSYVAVGYPHAHNVNISYNILENVTATWGAIHLHGHASESPPYHQADGGYVGYNTISGAVGIGIWTVGNDDVTIEHNHVLNNTGDRAIEAINHVGTGIVIHGNTITNSGGKGINYWAEDGGVITDNVITNSTYEAIFTDAQATISGNQISGGGGYGIIVVGSAGGSTISGNTISGTSAEALRILAQATITNNNTTGGYHGVFIGSGAGGSVVDQNIISSPDWIGIQSSAPVDITNSDITGGWGGIEILSGADGSTVVGNTVSGTAAEALRVKAQATITNNNISGGYGGIVIFSGAGGSVVDQNIISSPDWIGIKSSVPVDITNSDITGGWGGIEILSGADGSTVVGNTVSGTAAEALRVWAQATITNNDFSGGYGGIGIWADGTVIDGNNIHDNQYRGLDIFDGVTVATITNNQLANNPYTGVMVWSDGDGSGIHINCNKITGNGIYGVESQRTVSAVDATHNWWGNANGPTHASNIGGTGDAVSDYVNYANWALLPLDGLISGTVTDNSSNGIEGVTVKVLDDGNNPVCDPEITGADGRFYFNCNDLVPETYSVMIVTPLGYSVEPGETQNDIVVTEYPCTEVHFVLTPTITTNDCRSIGYWKHQFDVYTSSRGNAQESSTALEAYLDLVHVHFDVLGVYSGLDIYDFVDAKNVLTVRGGRLMADRAEQQLFALLLNFASGRIGNETVVSEDTPGRVAAEAVTLVAVLLKDGDPDNDELAKTICDLINSGEMVAAGIIPESPIRYKFEIERLPQTFSLSQNYPNPFNAQTTIEYSLPEAGHVTVVVYDLLGKKVATPVDAYEEAGHHSINWNASEVASGMYFYEIQVGTNVEIRRMLLLK